MGEENDEASTNLTHTVKHNAMVVSCRFSLKHFFCGGKNHQITRRERDRESVQLLRLKPPPFLLLLWPEVAVPHCAYLATPVFCEAVVSLRSSRAIRAEA
ncbi:unnamed protein product [Spodoptera exigua]|nr:unnamed protein product [Spodoptera exigua]